MNIQARFTTLIGKAIIYIHQYIPMARGAPKPNQSNWNRTEYLCLYNLSYVYQVKYIILEVCITMVIQM